MYLLKTLIERWQVKPPASVSDCLKEMILLLSDNMQRNYTPKGLDDICHFKKHKGKRFIDVINDDPQYMSWIIGNIEGVELNEEAHNYLIEKENQ